MNRIDPKLAATLRQPAELVAHGLAPAADLADLERVATRYAIAVTPDIADLIDSENPDDPIARQFIPNVRELVEQPGEIADPARVTPEMVTALKVEGATTWLAIHANHPRELSGTARAAVARLADAGIPLVSQSVLLRGVNDDEATLEALMRALVE